MSQLTPGTHYNYSVCGHTLLISQEQPTRHDVAAVNQGDAAFALMVRDDIVFMLIKLGDRPWRLSHYNWWINPPFLRPDPQTDLASAAHGIAMLTCLADARTGLVAAARSFPLSADFGRTLLQTVERQVRLGVDTWHQLEVALEFLDRSSDLKWLLKEALCVQFCSADGCEPGQAPKRGGRVHPPGRRCALARKGKPDDQPSTQGGWGQ